MHGGASSQRSGDLNRSPSGRSAPLPRSTPPASKRSGSDAPMALRRRTRKPCPSPGVIEAAERFVNRSPVWTFPVFPRARGEEAEIRGRRHWFESPPVPAVCSLRFPAFPASAPSVSRRSRRPLPPGSGPPRPFMGPRDRPRALHDLSAPGEAPSAPGEAPSYLPGRHPLLPGKHPLISRGGTLSAPGEAPIPLRRNPQLPLPDPPPARLSRELSEISPPPWGKSSYPIHGSCQYAEPSSGDPCNRGGTGDLNMGTRVPT
jgi:hypothetical protein